MAVDSDVKRREQKPRERLLQGRFMMCPRCRERFDVLRFIPMGIIEEFKAELNPIYKCPSCRWVFSPAATINELKEMFGITENSSEENS